MQIEKITILGGYGKYGDKEMIDRIEIKMGEVVSIVGPTGCGKTTLINDIELYANRNTPSKRRVLINDKVLSEELVGNPSEHPIALISQHTNFLSDLPVDEFLKIHASIRGSSNIEEMVLQTLNFANQLTGESINPRVSMTELSGGQTRSLLIADAVIIGNSPIILLDEIENAGIHRTKALELLRNYNKIFIFVTHDPRITLLSKFRIIMKNGIMTKVIYTGKEEKRIIDELKKIDDTLLECRQLIRAGEEITESVYKEKIKNKFYL